MITEIEEIIPNCLAAVGEIVNRTMAVISAATMIRPRYGVPALLTLEKIAGKRPSSAAALADWPTTSVQPPSEPRQPAAAQKDTIAPPIGPTAMVTASANGAEDATSSLLGIIPMMALLEST